MDCPGSSWGDHQAACDRQLAARIECQVEDIDGTISGELNRGGKKPLAPKLQRRICLFIDVKLPPKTNKQNLGENGAQALKLRDPHKAREFVGGWGGVGGGGQQGQFRGSQE